MTGYSILENARFFQLSQKLVPFTVRLYEDLIRSHIRLRPDDRLLDIGCGTGGHRRYFDCDYSGIDCNPAYIRYASRHMTGNFRTMDAAALEFEPDSFDHIVVIATLHHLSDAQTASMLRSARRILKPNGRLHVIDAILPLDSAQRLKRWLFLNDRGQHPRTYDELKRLVTETASSKPEEDFRSGLLHDVAYFAVCR